MVLVDEVALWAQTSSMAAKVSVALKSEAQEQLVRDVVDMTADATTVSCAGPVSAPHCAGEPGAPPSMTLCYRPPEPGAIYPPRSVAVHSWLAREGRTSAERVVLRAVRRRGHGLVDWSPGDLLRQFS